MNLRKHTIWVAGLAALAVLGQGCVDGDLAVVVTGAKGATSTAGTCSPGTANLAFGTVDTTDPLRRGYFLFATIENTLLSNKTGKEPEANNLFLDEMLVDIDVSTVTGLQAPSAETKFSAPVSTSLLKPGATVTTAANVIPGNLLARMNLPTNTTAQILVAIQARARHGGGTVVSPPFKFPVTVCTGCLVDLQATCPSATVAAQLQTHPCGLAQDGPVVCCQQSNGRPVKCLGKSN